MMGTISSTNKQCIGCFQFIKDLFSPICIECRTCIGKKAFSSKATAKASAEWYKDDSSFELFEYKCIYCSLFHLTSRNKIEEVV
tara:strand:+ start:662 stop:913 length:252 start_codon:yes stop_codon:yes gene_type:complete